MMATISSIISFTRTNLFTSQEPILSTPTMFAAIQSEAYPFPKTHFFLPPNQVNMSLFFDCVSVSELPTSLGFYKVVCDAKYGTNVTLSLYSYDDSELGYASRYCNKTVVLPAPVYLPGNETGVQGILNQGFILEWKSSKCRVCEASGGKCGFDDNTNNFKCFCQDRPRPSSCAHDLFFSHSIVLYLFIDPVGKEVFYCWDSSGDYSPGLLYKNILI
ncbi:hypothetical protein J1N35_038071 [Gossypium stocksii]|uniref:Wall-associated receptor kinase C-terminal domain-containing protein n=1 Tax=Gossypium stocksii TaxID=47602 RepID=A0A9D3ULD1_9ROSI|nr:hypothetical protein J1N35_038071 [Gossypium stocksii]